LVDAIDPAPLASDFPNKIGPWPPPAEMVLVLSHLSGSGATPDPLRCSCVLGHRRLAPTVVMVTVLISNPHRGRLLFAVMPSDSIFSRRPSVLSLASEMRPIRSAFARSEWVCVL
jgi:hypothetical protein